MEGAGESDEKGEEGVMMTLIVCVVLEKALSLDVPSALMLGIYRTPEDGVTAGAGGTAAEVYPASPTPAESSRSASLSFSTGKAGDSAPGVQKPSSYLTRRIGPVRETGRRRRERSSTSKGNSSVVKSAGECDGSRNGAI